MDANDVALPISVTPDRAPALPTVCIKPIVEPSTSEREDIVSVPPLGSIGLVPGVPRSIDAQP